MIKRNTQRVTHTVLGLSAVLGLGACTPTTQPWLGRADIQAPWLGRTHQVPQAQPYAQPQMPPPQTAPQVYQPHQPPLQGVLPEAQPPRYVPLPPAVQPYHYDQSPQASGSRPVSPEPVATTRPLWEEENVRVQTLPAPRPAPAPVPLTVPAPAASPAPVPAPAPVSKPVDDDPGNRYMDMAAVQVLTTQANTAVQAEEWGRASDALERALRIQPDNPRLWLRLGEVYKEQGNKQQAAEMARKAMQIAPGDAYIERRAGLLLK